MALTVECSVSDILADEDEEVPECPHTDLISAWARQAFLLTEDRSLSVQIVSENEMQQLNRDWRGQDKATNVLSFPMDIDASLMSHLVVDDEPQLLPLGDLALCAAVINREANEQGKSLHGHWAHMVVHGTLHLQGYDHGNDSEAEAMEALEINILQTLGFDNPYLTRQNEIQA